MTSRPRTGRQVVRKSKRVDDLGNSKVMRASRATRAQLAAKVGATYIQSIQEYC